MTAKLHISIKDGVLSVEGDEAFVQSIYSDFRQRLIEEVSHIRIDQSRLDTIPAQLPSNADSKNGKAKSSVTSKAKATGYKFEVNPDLDLAKLPDFFSQFAPTNVSEKILIFAVFIRDHLHKSPCSANDIYSCFFALKNKIKIPEAFYQAFVTAWNRTKWIQYESMEEIRITTAGENHFTDMQKAKPAE